MLVRRTALAHAGGLARIRDAIIDDVALARLLKPRGRVWLGLSSSIVSVRPYSRLADLWQMVTRSAYTQLRYSPAVLAATVAGLLLTYVWPPTAAAIGVIGDDPVLAVLGAASWVVMAGTYIPTLRFYRVPLAWAFAVPAIAVLYTAMTVDSARQHAVGRGAAWKGRVVSDVASG